MIDAQLLDTWQIHQRILLYLLDAIPDEALTGVPTGMKGRSVGQILAHLHNIRFTWLEVSAPPLAESLQRIKTRSQADQATITKTLLHTSLTASGEAIQNLLQQGLEKGKIKDWKPHLVSFFSYLMAHEWYHHGEICLILTQIGHPLDDKVLYGIWEWKHFAE